MFNNKIVRRGTNILRVLEKNDWVSCRVKRSHNVNLYSKFNTLLSFVLLSILYILILHYSKILSLVKEKTNMRDLQSLQEVFKNKIFRIPDYQRGYAWTQRQLFDFWEDLINLQQNRNHYTGVLSLRKVPDLICMNWNEEKWLIDERSYNAYYIVDGQQRITTFVILIQAIIEFLRKLDENIDKTDDNIYLGTFSLKQIREDYVVSEKPPQNIIKSYKFGYESDNPSFEFLRYNILGESDGGTLLETFYTLNLYNSKIFFHDNLIKYYEINKLDGILLLFKKLTQKLMFNVYEMSDDFDVFVAFETINNRGKKLSNLELLKNRLIYLTTLYSEDEIKTDEKISLREKINNAWREIYYQLGRNKKKPLNDDEFLNAHWIIYFQYSRKKGEAYMNFLLGEQFIPQNIYEKTEINSDNLESFSELTDINNADLDESDFEVEDSSNGRVSKSKLTPKEIENYVNSLKSSVVHWYNSWNPVNNDDLSQEEQLWIERLNRIGITYFRPMVVASFLSPTQSVQDRVMLFTAIERFIFIAFRLAQAKSTFGSSEFYRFARSLAKGEVGVDVIIDELEVKLQVFCYYSYEDQDEVFFDSSLFMTHIERKYKSAEGYYSWNGLRYFLYEYEMSKVRERGSQKIDWVLFTKSEKDKVSIEHIFPQTPNRKEWPAFFKSGTSKNHKLYQGLLGNLLPLSMSINSSLQNDSFDAKKKPKYNEKKQKIRQGYNDGSHSEIEVSQKKEWTPELIFQRTMDLLNFMDERWNVKFENEKSKKELIYFEYNKIK
jgi:hypothetical protein